MVWKDCFGRDLIDGEDVIVGVVDNEKIELHAGIILELNENDIYITYNGWNSNGTEYTVGKYFLKEDYPTGVIKDIFKVFN